jgi:predicted nucleotidyltransferase
LRHSMLICGTPSEFLLKFDKEIGISASEIFKIIRQNKEKLSQLGVRQTGLFGSQSRGDATPDSDLDFLVEFIKGRKNYDNYIELCFFLEDLFSKKIDLLTPESLSPHLKEQILREVQYETIH